MAREELSHGLLPRLNCYLIYCCPLQASCPPIQLEPVDLSVKTPGSVVQSPTVVLQVPRYSPQLINKAITGIQLYFILLIFNRALIASWEFTLLAIY